jgi:hypothetical protein
MLTVIALCTRECLAIDVGQSLIGGGCREGSQRDLRAARTAQDDQDRQRQRAHLQSHGQVDLRARGRTRLQQAWQADGQRRRGELQRTAAPGVSERELARVIGRRSGQDLGLGDLLQLESIPLCARVGDTRQIRPPLLPAGSNGDVKGAGSLYYREVLKWVQGHNSSSLDRSATKRRGSTGIERLDPKTRLQSAEVISISTLETFRCPDADLREVSQPIWRLRRATSVIAPRPARSIA